MRTFSTEQEDILKSAKFDVHLRVEVENATGAFKNLSSLDGSDWVEKVQWDWDLDQSVPEARIQLRRDITDGKSLAPLDEASTFNVTDAGSTAALLDAGRLIRIYTATLAAGSAAPATSEFDRMLDAEIDEVNWGHSPIDIVARSFVMAALNDQWVETVTIYGSDEGIAIETVMQSILDDHTDLGITLNTPVVPGFLITTYEQQQMSVLQALVTLAQLIGFDLRERWDDATSSFRLTFSEPDRAASTDQWTFNKSQYHDVRQLSISRRDIRNVVSILYTSTSDAQRKEVEVESTASQDRYGRRWMQIVEGSDSPIASSSEANVFAQAAVDDLDEPDAIQEIETPYWWPGDLQDFIGFTANDIHYSVDQSFGVYGIRHELSRERHRTFVRVRGKPAGQYRGWLVNHRDRKRENPVERDDELRLANFRRVHNSTAGTVTFKWDWAGRVQQCWIYEKTVADPATEDVFDDFGSQLPSTILDRTLDTPEHVVTFPSNDNTTVLEFQPRDFNSQSGTVIRILVSPQGLVDAADIPDGTIVAEKLTENAQNFVSDMTFSASDFDTVAWSSGFLTLAGSTQFTIDAGNTGDMSTDIHYIFLDSQVSTTILQVTTNSTGVVAGAGQLLLAVAKQAASTAQNAFFVPSVGVLGMNEEQLSPDSVSTTLIQDDAITTPKLVTDAVSAGKIQAGAIVAGKIAAGTIVTGDIAANTITASNMNVAQLSAISADMGTLTAGTVEANVIVAAESFTATQADFNDVQIGTSSGSGGGPGFGQLTVWDVALFSGAGQVKIEDGRILRLTDASDLPGGTLLASSNVMVAGGAWEFQSGIGFYQTSPVSQGTVEGARDNPEGALADLLSKLEDTGLIVDNTSSS